MPTDKQLENMSMAVYGCTYDDLSYFDERKLQVMRLTIAAIQAKALADIAYMQGLKG